MDPRETYMSRPVCSPNKIQSISHLNSISRPQSPYLNYTLTSLQFTSRCAASPDQAPATESPSCSPRPRHLPHHPHHCHHLHLHHLHHPLQNRNHSLHRNHTPSSSASQTWTQRKPSSGVKTPRRWIHSALVTVLIFGLSTLCPLSLQLL